MSTTGIELYSKLNDPIQAIERLGIMFAKSGFAGCDRPEQGQTLAWICLAERKSPVEIVRNYHIIEGRLQKKAMAAYAEFRARGAKVRWVNTGDDGKEARAEITFEGQTVVCAFSMDQARAQGLVRPRSNWERTPGNMLRARVISNAIGMLCPEIYAGDTADESPSDAPELTLEVSPVTATEPKPVQRAKVYELHTQAGMQEAARETVIPQPESEVQPQAEPAPAPELAREFAKGPAYTAPANGQCSPELLQQVEDLLAPVAPQAQAWMVKEGWLQTGQGLEHLTDARVRRILKQRDSFLRAVGGAQ